MRKGKIGRRGFEMIGGNSCFLKLSEEGNFKKRNKQTKKKAELE